MTKATWDKQRNELLRKLWPTDMPAREIADLMGPDVTRAAVIGRANRIGLPPRRIVERKNKKVSIIPLPQATEITGPGISMMELTETTCRFPQGDPKKPDFSFCGCKVTDRPYCRFHADIVWTKDQRLYKYREYVKERTEPLAELEKIQ